MTNLITNIPFKLLIINILLLSRFTFYAQENFSNGKTDFNIAKEFFNNKQYTEALPHFADLIKKYSKDPIYSYYYGICLLETGDINGSIDFLRYASTQNAPVDVYYYLGKAYHYDYQFLKAIQYYKRFQLYAETAQVKELDIERLINMCYNGEYLLKYIPELKVLNSNFVNAESFYNSYSIQELNGKLIEKPSRLKSVREIESGETSIMFVPDYIDIDDVLFFSGYNENGENGKDIFMIRKVGEGKWSAPQNLGNIVNSKYDEDFPYMDNNEMTLYFASKGHYSMGGYDIYKTIYSSETDTWSPPENLDFPINSPFDDFMYIPDPYLNYAVFTSNRNSKQNKLGMYTVQLTGTRLQQEISDINEIRKCALLLPSVEDDSIDVIKPEVIKEPVEGQSIDLVDNEIKKIENQYQILLRKTLQIQKQLDSIELVNKNYLKKIINSKSDDEKKMLRKNFDTNKKQIAELQKLANEQYVKIKEIEFKYLLSYIDKYSSDEKPKKAKIEDFLQLKEIQNLFGEKEITNLNSINSSIENTLNTINKADLSVNQIKELKELQKSTKDKKEIKRIEKKIGKIENDSYTIKINAYKSIHGLILKKFEIYRQYLPEAEKNQENEMILGYADDKMQLAARYLQKSAKIHETIENYKQESYKIKKLKSADTLDLKSMEILESVFMVLYNYEIDDGKPIEIKEVFDVTLYQVDETIDSILNSYKKLTENIIVIIDSISMADNNLIISKEIDSIELENTDNKVKTIIQPTSVPEYTDEFEMKGQPVYSDNNPIPMNSILPSGILYRIQLGVFSAEPEPLKFKGFYPVTGDTTSNGYYKYYAGMFKNYQSAENVIKLIKDEGFNDAFIVAWKNGDKIPVDQAKALEPKNQVILAPEKKVTENPGSNEMEFKIQIGAFKGEMPQDILQTFKNLASEKIVEEFINENGIRIYTIGNFYNFEKAKEFKNYLVENGHTSVFVIALKNGRKIPVADAIKEIENK